MREIVWNCFPRRKNTIFDAIEKQHQHKQRREGSSTNHNHPQHQGTSKQASKQTERDEITNDKMEQSPSKRDAAVASPTPRELLEHIPIGHPDSMMSKESVRRAVEDFRTRPTDVIVATFPKTGTTLVTWICHLLRTDASPIDDKTDDNDNDNQNGNQNQNNNHQQEQQQEKEQEHQHQPQRTSFETLYEVVPWPTLSWDIGYDPNVQGSQFTPRVFKSHLRMASIYPGCKYVVTVRDPAKTVLSFYNFFVAKKVPFLVDDEHDGKCDSNGDGTSTTAPKLKMDVSTFLLDMPFVKGSPQTPTSNLRASIWDYYAEYHALMECPSVLILVYEDFLAGRGEGDGSNSKRGQIRRLSRFLGITSSDGDHRQETDLVDRTAALSTKEYMAGHMRKFDEPYERAKALNRAADISQLAPGAKVVLGTHAQRLDDRAQQFLEDRWRLQMEPLGYRDYEAFASAVRQRNQRLFGILS